MCYFNGAIGSTLHNEFRSETLVKFYNAESVPDFLTESESCTPTKANKRRIQSKEMKFLRSVAGYTRDDGKENAKILEELNIQEVDCKRKSMIVNDSGIITSVG